MSIINLNVSNRVTHDKPLVTLQKEAVRFNEHFINELKKKLKIEKVKDNIFVKIDIDPDDFTILFTFFKTKEINGTKLNKITFNNIVRSRPLFHHTWIKNSFDDKINSNQWNLIHLEKFTWTCHLIPSASLKLNKNEINELDELTNGLYELYDKFGNLLYVGISDSKKGIKSRLKEHLKDKEFEYVKYAAISDLSKLREYENTILNNYKQKFGRLPYYNKQV